MEGAQAIEISINAYTLGAFIGYLLLMIAIGVLSARFSSQGIGNFFIAGRKLNYVVVALSAVVSGRSSWLLIGLTGMAYMRGLSVIWAVVGYTIMEFLLFFFYAPRIRRFTEAFDCITVPDFFAERFEDRSGVLRIILVTVIIIFLVGYTSAQFIAGGKTLASSFGIAPLWGMVITALFVLFYTIIGGFLAVSITDTVQAVIIVAALVILPVVAVVSLGGWSEVMASLGDLHQLREVGEQLQLTDLAMVDPMALGAGALIGFVGLGLGSPGNPHIIVRYMSIDNAKQLKATAFVGTLSNILMGVGAVLVGAIARAYIPEAAGLPNGDPEQAYPVLAYHFLHPVLFGTIVASIFAAIMSTTDSQLLVAASSVVRDVYEKVYNRGRELSQPFLVKYSRVVVSILVVLAFLLGLAVEDVVFWLALFAWSGLGAAIGPTSILALYWRGTTKQGVLAGFLTGTIVTIVWYFMPEVTIGGMTLPALKSIIHEIIPGFFSSLFMTVIVSQFTLPPMNRDQMFEAMEEQKAHYKGMI